jgi:hypothetical protein
MVAFTHLVSIAPRGGGDIDVSFVGSKLEAAAPLIQYIKYGPRCRRRHKCLKSYIATHLYHNTHYLPTPNIEVAMFYTSTACRGSLEEREIL